eukprot:3963726-Prymnesium_polylepis.1
MRGLLWVCCRRRGRRSRRRIDGSRAERRLARHDGSQGRGDPQCGVRIDHPRAHHLREPTTREIAHIPAALTPASHCGLCLIADCAPFLSTAP